MIYEITDEKDVPMELTSTYLAGKVIMLETCIGWITLDEPSFNVGLRYKIKED